MEVADETAVALARTGDCDAFRLLVERHSRKIFRLAYRMTGNQDDADEIVQETFIRAYRNLHQFDEKAVFSSWLYRIASNYSLDVLRMRKSRPVRSLAMAAGESEDVNPVDRLASGAPTPDRLVFSDQVRHKIAEAMDELTPQERSAFTLRHFEGHTIEEISAALNLSRNGAKHAVFRAVQKMRRALEPIEGETAWRN